MIDEMKNGSYKSLNIYIANDNQELKQISTAVVQDFVYSVEITCDRFRSAMQMALTVNHELIKHSIGKEADFLNAKNIIRIVVVDENDYIFDRTFVVKKASRSTDQADKNGDTYVIACRDIYSYYLSQVSPSVSAQSYKGKPIEIFEQIFKDAVKLTDEILSSYHIPILAVRTETNTLDFITPIDEVSYKCQQNKSALENLDKLGTLYNIALYQNFDGYHIVENPVFNNMDPSVLKDGSELWREAAPTGYPFKICDKIKRCKSPDIMQSANVTISLNKGGKSQVTQNIKTADLLKLVELNGNTEEFTDIFETREVTESSGSTSNLSLIRQYMYKYIQYNNMAIYVSSTLRECNPGTVTSVRINAVTGFTPEKAQGDYRYSGNWLIRNCTFKIVNNRFFVRLILCRFDNPKSTANLSEVCAESRTDTTFYSNKPANRAIDRTAVINALDDVNKDLSNLTGSFKQKLTAMSREMQGYSNYAQQKIDSLTIPIKQQFINQVQDTEIYKNVTNVINKNKKTLNAINNIVAKKTGINLAGISNVANEIMNIDSVIKEATIGQLERVYSDVTGKIANAVNGVTSAVTNTVTAAQNTLNAINDMSTNLSDCELNLDQNLDDIRRVYRSINETKNQVDRTVKTVKELKKAVNDIPNSVKLVNPVEVLKEKRNKMISSIKVGQKSKERVGKIIADEIL